MAAGPRVLVVDDSEFILQLLETILETEGYQPVLALDGATALKLALAEPPDAILLDIRMPGMDGWDVLRELRANQATRRVPVAVMSTQDDRLGWTLSLGREAQAYVMKPFSPTDLLATLREILTKAPPKALPETS